MVLRNSSKTVPPTATKTMRATESLPSEPCTDDPEHCVRYSATRRSKRGPAAMHAMHSDRMVFPHPVGALRTPRDGKEPATSCQWADMGILRDPPIVISFKLASETWKDDIMW